MDSPRRRGTWRSRARANSCRCVEDTEYIRALARGLSVRPHTRSVSTVRLGLVSRNQRVENLNTWLVCSEGDVANLARMPQHAQREISASVVALGVHSFEASLRADTHWDSAKRLVNWLAHQGALSGRWTQVVPWDRVGYLNMANTAYVVSFCRRY
eukprot:COSAG03_NODE_1073_length_4898_cov_10.426339_9_plen_155_part_01